MSSVLRAAARRRGVRGAGGRCQGGIDPVLDSAGVDDEEVTALAIEGATPGRLGRPARADSRAPDGHGARDAVDEALHDRAVNGC